MKLLFPVLLAHLTIVVVISQSVLLVGGTVSRYYGKRAPDWEMRAMYYSPSTIGTDPHVRKIDIYSDFFKDLHHRDLPLLRKLGVTHVIVSENWAAVDASKVNPHRGFVETMAKNNLKLIVTYALPTEGDTAKRDKFKELFLLLLKEFSDPFYASVLSGYRIPAPPTAEMSTKEVEDYFSLVNELSNLVRNTLYPKSLYTGFPIDPRDSSAYTYNYALVDTSFWIVNVYTSDTKQSIDAYTSAWDNIGNAKKILPMITTSSWNVINRAPNSTMQAQLVNSIYTALLANRDMTIGVGIFEFSDEWWRSDLSKVGFDEKGEGCPNSNAYAHTMCGILVQATDGSQAILSLEYNGLFEIISVPFRFCVVAKETATNLQATWTVVNTSSDNYIAPGRAYCAFLPGIVPWIYVLPILGVLSFTVFILILVLQPPAASVIKDRELKLLTTDEFM